jgi:hypothetical protein
MNFQEVQGNTKLLLKKSNRDDCMSEKIPKDSGIPNTPSFLYIVGKPGSGKSLMLESLLSEQYRIGKGKETCFDSIFYFCPKTSQGSYHNSFVEDLDPDKIHHELTPDNLSDVIEEIEEMNPEDGKDQWGRKVEPRYACIIFDDMITELKSRHIRPIVGRIGKNFRHLRLLIIVISQNYILLDKPTRDNVSHLIQFQTTNRKELERLNDEWFGQFDRHQFEDFWNFIHDKQFNFVIANRRNDEFCKCFNPITYNLPGGEGVGVVKREQ